MVECKIGCLGPQRGRLPWVTKQMTNKSRSFALSIIGESRQPWAGVCLGPIVFFQKVWKEKF